MYRKVIQFFFQSIFFVFCFSAIFAGPCLLRCRNFATKGQGLYLSVTFFVELIFRRGSCYTMYDEAQKRREYLCII